MAKSADWMPRHGSVVALSQALIMEWNPKAATFFERSPARGTGIYAAWTKDVDEAGFVDTETFSFDVGVPYTAEAWRGRIRASAWVGATRDPEWVARFDAEHARRLHEAFPSGEFLAPHRVWALVARSGESDARRHVE